MGAAPSGSQNYGGFAGETVFRWDKADTDDMVVDDQVDDPNQTTWNMYMVFLVMLIGIPVYRYIYQQYISVVVDKLSESFKRISERVSDSRVRNHFIIIIQLPIYL